jgi:AcrR family transcriptional regulator
VSAAKPLRGRQAEAARNDELVLRAAREVFAERGPDTTVAAIARRAGVGMGSLYRRYGAKEELLQRVCVLALEQNRDAAGRALSTADPWEGLCGYVRDCVSFGAGAFGPLAGRISASDEMFRLARAVRRRVGELVRRAHADGSLRADANHLDILLLIERFSRAFAPEDDEHLRRRQLEIALDGLRAGGRQALPGPAPTAREYERRWS